MLFIEVVGDQDAVRVVDALRARDNEGLVSVEVAPPRPVGFRVAAPSAHADEAVDAVITAAEPLDAQVDSLWRKRLRPLAAGLAGRPLTSSPAVIQAYDPEWEWSARRRLDRVRRVLEAFDPEGEFRYDHIGSTSVPGLGAKAIIDLQVRVPRIPEPDALDEAMHRVGYLAARGSRPDSPGVHRDNPRGTEVVPDEVWAKRLFFSPDPVLPSIVHIRRTDSPFGKHTVRFRDWLRAHPDQRDRYHRFKLRLAEEHAGDRDYDDYTRAKTRFFDEVHGLFEEWAAGRSST